MGGIIIRVGLCKLSVGVVSFLHDVCTVHVVECIEILIINVVPFSPPPLLQVLIIYRMCRIFVMLSVM